MEPFGEVIQRLDRIALDLNPRSVSDGDHVESHLMRSALALLSYLPDTLQYSIIDLKVGIAAWSQDAPS